jgi:hypothetical protein
MREEYLLSVYSLKNGALVREVWYDTLTEAVETSKGYPTTEFESDIRTAYFTIDLDNQMMMPNGDIHVNLPF